MHRFLLTLLFVATSSLMSFGQVANPQGFFLNDAVPKNATIPPSVDAEKPTDDPTVTVNVDASNVIAPVSKYIYGHNSNIYMTQMVNQTKLINHIKELEPNVIRFPGGNLSSIYFWNSEPGSPPADAPAKLVDGATGQEKDAGYWFGKNTADWTMSLDNFYAMLETTGNTGMITVNYGYARYSTAEDPVAAAAHLAADWVRYDNGRTKFWEIGNESNGNWQAGWRINTANNKDGQPQIMQGTLYGEHFKVFVDSMQAAAAEVGSTIYIGAQLLQEAPAGWWSDTDKNWNSGVFQKAGSTPDFYIIHSYYTPYNTNSNASDILSSATTVTGDMMTYVKTAIQNAGLPAKPLALTEWNIFAVGSKQMVSYVSGMHATLVLGELIKNQYGMASRWDLANAYENGNDHGLFSQGDEPETSTPKWNPRPSFYYMYYFQKYFGDNMVNATVTGSMDVIAYASTFESGESGIVIVNKGSSAKVVEVNVNNYGFGDHYYWYSLTGGNDNGEFSRKVYVNGATTTFASGGPANVTTINAKKAAIGAGILVAAPAKSVQYILIEEGENVILGMEDDDSPLQLFPNPSDGTFRIDLQSEQYTSMHIRDVQGREVHRQSIPPGQSVVTASFKLPSGMYLVTLNGNRRSKISKILIR
jgi:Secretion system C-terminal sorting domain